MVLWHFSEPTLFLSAVITFLVILEVGFRLGRRHYQKGDETAQTHVSALQAAVLGLLALLLGFNFAMAATRFETRKALLQDEVEAINSAYLRGQLLPTPQKEEVSNLLRAYINTRIDFALAGSDDSLVDKASVNALRIEGQLWEITSLMMNQDSIGPAKSMFAESVNDIVNVNLQRRAAIDNHVPEIVIHLLFLVAVGAMGFIAYGYGLTGKRRHGSTAIFAALIALVLTIILDLDQPRSGLIRIDEQSILRLKATMTEAKL